MQKRAFFKNVEYKTVFEPLPKEESSGMCYDKVPIKISYADDFPCLHYHNSFEVGVCTSGFGLFISEGSCSFFKEGDYFFIPPRKKHYSRSIDKSTDCFSKFIYVSEKMIDKLMPISLKDKYNSLAAGIPTVIRPTESYSASNHLKELFSAFDCDLEDIAHISALRISTLLLESKRWFSNKGKLESRFNSHVSRCAESVAPAAEYIFLHYSENVAAKELADLCHMSESQLRRNFISAYGITPFAYKNKLRMHIADELITQTSLPLYGIAEALGFNSPSDFCRMYKEINGKSPGSARKEKSYTSPKNNTDENTQINKEET